MRLNLTKYHGLRHASHSARRAPAFTLAELVVAIGVLVLMLSLTGQVFNLTVKSTGQATALVEVAQQLRALESTLREDLRNVTPGQSMMVIQGNPVNAYWTQDGKDAATGPPANGYPHIADPERERTLADGTTVMDHPRADMLMFFTGRKASSYVDPGVTSNLQQVVYGHAELGDYGAKSSTPSPSASAIYPKNSTDVGKLPAERWHLARRSVLIAPGYIPQVPPDPDIPEQYEFRGVLGKVHTVCDKQFIEEQERVTGLADECLLQGATDVVGWWQGQNLDEPLAPFKYEQNVLTPHADNGIGEWYLPAIFPPFEELINGTLLVERSIIDLNPPPRLGDRLGHFMLANCASFKVEWTLDPHGDFVAGRLSGSNEVYWFDPGYMQDPSSPNLAADDPFKSMADAIRQLDKQLNGGGGGDIEDICGPPPTMQTGRLGKLCDILTAPTEHPNGEIYSLPERFHHQDPDANQWISFSPDGRTNTHVFLAKHERTSGGPSEYVAEDVFPSALRITVDVYDAARRLDRPVRHVMVIPVGG